MMGTEGDTASEDGLAQVCSASTLKIYLPSVGLAVFFSLFPEYLHELKLQHRQ